MSVFDDPIPFGVWYFALPCSNEDCEGTIPLAIRPRPDKPVPLMRALRRQTRLTCGACHQPGAAASGETGRLDLPDGTTFTFSILAATGSAVEKMSPLDGADNLTRLPEAARSADPAWDGAERTGNSTR
jgi:hypothetical protein